MKIIVAFPQDGTATATKIAPMGQMKTIAQLLHVQRTNLSAPREVPMRRLNVLIKLSFVTAKKTVKMALMKEQLAVSFFFLAFFKRFMTFFGVKRDNHLSRIPSILQ